MFASARCLGPWVLVSLGFGGAWLASLIALEAYRPLFIGAALIALFFAYRRIFRPMPACEPGEACAAPRVRSAYKITFWIVAALVVIAIAFPYALALFF